MGKPERAAEVERLLARAVDWASRRSDVRGLALVGSEARGTATFGSDVDLVLLTEDIAAYVDDDRWISGLGEAAPVATRRWGRVTERRIALRSGLEVEVGIAPLSWAARHPVDAGTGEVVRGGMRALYDPDGLLKSLLDEW